MLKQPVAALLALVVIAALFIGGAQPQAVALVPEGWDKVIHAGVYFVLALLLAQGFVLSTGWVALLALLLGAADEWHQLYLPGRHSQGGRLRRSSGRPERPA